MDIFFSSLKIKTRLNSITPPIFPHSEKVVGLDVIEVAVPNLQWYGDTSLVLEFPAVWKVKRCKINSEDQQGMTEEQIRASLMSPIGSRSLGQLAEGSEETAIIIDDMTRPTKSFQYLPYVIETLRKFGVKQDNIRFIMASGAHGTFRRLDFVKKLGEDIVAEYQTYNHNPYEYLDYLGDTSFGSPVHINSEVMSCDLKIGIGTVLFHRLMGFSGGGKMILPGVAGIDTIEYNHDHVGGFGPEKQPHSSTGYLKNDLNQMRLDAEEAAHMAKLDFKVDTVLNLNRDPVEVNAGYFVETQRKSSKAAKWWHRSEAPTDMDVVVANTYMRANEAFIGMWPAYCSVKEEGSIVLIANDPDGEINHWIFGRHGKNMGARLWNPKRRPLHRGRRLIIYSPYKKRSYDLRLGLPEQTTWLTDWAEVIEVLKTEHGPGTRVAVLPDATSGIPETMLEESV